MNFKQQMVASATLVMKITVVQIFLAIIFMCSLYAKEAKAQSVLERKITLSVKNEPLNKVIKDITKQIKVDFSFSESAIKKDLAITCFVKNKTLLDFLEKNLNIYNISYRVVNEEIVLFQNNKTGDVIDDSGIIQSGAQMLADVVVAGYVYGDDGQSLPGVTIKEKGTSNATSTDVKGYFSIKVKNSAAVLIISSIGFVNQEITVGIQKTLKVKLVPNSTNLQDVVVVGYGTQKVINRTGSSSSISTKDLIQSPVANISNSLAGRMPGVFASQAGGEPGHDASKIRIRGVGTFTGNTDPLFLVDGIEVTNYDNIDANEIESVTILKDATSTAVYGIRGANGVIIITTRRGKVGPPQVSYSFNQALNSFTELQHTINSVDFANGYNQAKLNDTYVSGSQYVPQYTANDIALFQSGADPIFHSNTDWRSLLFKKVSLQSQHNITIKGGQKSVQYFISAGFFSQDGLFADTRTVTTEFSAESTFKRYNFRSNFNFDITKRLKARLDVSSQTQNLSGNNQNNVDNTLSTKRVISDILRAAPTEGPGVIDGKLVVLPSGGNNPYISLIAANGAQGGAGGLRREYDNTLNGTFRLDHDLDFITKGFKVHADLALTTINTQVLINLKQLNVYTATPLPNGTVNLVPQSVNATPEFKFSQPATPGSRRITSEFGFDYDRSFGNHNITGLLLYNQQKTYDPNLLYDIPKGYQSYVGRVTYAYKSRYLAEFDGGYNGTENFAPGKQFGFFPAFSAGWVPSEEHFFPKNKIISFLKFRGSYGIVGNDNIGGARFLYIPTSYTYVSNTYYFGNVGSTLAGVTGVAEGKAGNPNVTWERAKKTDIGTDMYLFGEKIKVTGDYFYEDRSNILSNPNTISNDAGIIQPAVNLGRMTNQGFEAEITYNNSLNDFNYRISANYSYAHNHIVFEDEAPNANSYQNLTGQRYGQYYGIPVDGIYNTWAEVNDANRPVNQVSNNKIQPGDFKYRDVNGDGVINSFDSVPVGYSNIPEITYGFTIGGSYKGFDFSVLFQGVSHVTLGYNGYDTAIGYGAVPAQGGPDYLTQSWTAQRYAQGLPINFPRYTVSGGPNNLGGNFFTVDASYLRIKNAEIGYTIKANLLKKLGVGAARIYANGNNLYTWDKLLPGIDPENTPTNDTNQVNYPLVRTINFGLSVNF